MADLSRRGFLFGTASLVCAPALVKIQNMMRVQAVPAFLLPELVVFENRLLTLTDVTKQAVKLFNINNELLVYLSSEYTTLHTIGPEAPRLPA